jgi:hypothetical protein
MDAWFTLHMPNSPTETLAPSEHSGWIMGGPNSLRIAFTDEDLKAFCAKWEDADGKSLDPRFQCCVTLYADWWKQYGHYSPTFLKPKKAGVSVWIETPLGILSHVITDTEITSHPATARDIWANACQQWPELQTLNLEDLRYGCVAQTPECTTPWTFMWNFPFRKSFQTPEKASWLPILDWLCLPPDTETGSEW